MLLVTEMNLSLVSGLKNVEQKKKRMITSVVHVVISTTFLLAASCTFQNLSSYYKTDFIFYPTAKCI